MDLKKMSQVSIPALVVTNPGALQKQASSEDATETYSITSSDHDFVTNNKMSIWKKISRTTHAIWVTKDTISKDITDKESLIKTTLRELLIYLAFLATVTVIAANCMNPTMFYQTKIMSDLFLDASTSDGTTFRSASQMGHFWTFAEQVLVPNLYWDKYYNNASAGKLSGRSVLYENYLLGSPRLRQVRVRNDSCVVHPDFKRAISLCYGVYAEHLEDRSYRGFEPGFQWTAINTNADTGGTGMRSDVWGKFGTYSGAGGYIVDLTLDREAAAARLANIKQNLWIDRGTRAVFIDFTTYNPNVNLFVVTKLIAEFPATGGMVTSWQFRTLNLLQNSGNAKLIYAAFLLFTFFIAYYSIEEGIEIAHAGFCTYLKDSFWNTLDLLTIGIGVALVGFSIFRGHVINQIFNEATTNPPDQTTAASSWNATSLARTASSLYQMETYKFDTLGFWSTQFNNILAVLTFIVWVKVFKYISFNKTMSQLSSTLSRCSKDIAGFGVMFFIVFFAFAQLGYLLFGTQVKDYSSFGDAVFTLLRLILGDFDFYQLEAANRVLGPIFFLSYIFFVFFVLMNMFLAIINDTYAEVKAEIGDEDEFRLVDYFKKSYASMFNRLGNEKKQIEAVQEALRAKTGNKMSFDTVREELKKKNMTDAEIETLFSRYDTDGNRDLDESEFKQMMSDLEGKKKKIEQEMASTTPPDDAAAAGLVGGPGGMGPSLAALKKSVEEMSKLTRRVDRIEYTLSVISSKIDSVISGNMEVFSAQRERKVSDSVSRVTGRFMSLARRKSSAAGGLGGAGTPGAIRSKWGAGFGKSGTESGNESN